MPANTTRILLIEDNPGDARLLREVLKTSGDDHFVIGHAIRLSAARELLAESTFDILLSDLSLPDGTGLDTVRAVREMAPDLPIVVLTGMNDERVGVAALQAGAQDYLVKGQVDGNVLTRTIRYAIERHRMAAELEKTRQHELELKDQFLSHVSHELRSPLTTIYQFVTILLDGLAGELTEDQHEYLMIALKSVKQLRKMIGDLLDVTRAGNGKLALALEIVDPGELVADVVNSLEAAAYEKSITLKVGAATSQGVLADPDRLRQVLTNLVENALKFTPAGGSVIVTVQGDSAHGALRFEVTDTGCGISEEGTRLIFERLHQEANNVEASRKGLGLGLYICRELVMLHGGEIGATSTQGKGSTFHFTIPNGALQAAA